MRLDLTSVSDTYNEIRFIILHNDGSVTGTEVVQWYISEASFTSELLGAEPYFQLTAFNNSDAEGKGWALIETPPAGQDPGMPDTDTLNFAAKDFTDVRGMGFFYLGRRNGYHWQFSFDRFFALGEIE